jgi:membrane protease subunit (stomatin/prohibitin family)
MTLFGKKEGGLFDVIRCDEPSYLIWKWRPAGADANETKKENAIRWGSSLRVKDGETAVFVYKQKDGMMQDFIEGPFDDTIKTANFPVLASIIGAAFGGGSPFQAEVYFINLAGIIQVKFGVPYFDIFDPRFLDFAVPVAVRGTITFKLSDYKSFIKLHRLIDFDLNTFQLQIRDAIIKYVKGVIANIPQENSIPVIQLERKILAINEIIESYLKPRLQNDFGVTVSAVDVAAIEPDKESEGWHKLMSVTQDIIAETTQAQAAVNIQNMEDTQRINMENMEATLAIQREELQHAQRMQTDAANFAVHQLNQQTQVAMAGADAMGKMGQSGGMGSANGAGGMNPGAMMAGMALGGAVGQGMAGMMGSMLNNMNQQPGAAPLAPPLLAQYNVAVNGQSTGPFGMDQLVQMVRSGQLTGESMVWKQGMSAWTAAGTVQELASLFSQTVPPPLPPPVPPAQ